MFLQIPFPMWCPETVEFPSGTFTVPLPKSKYEFNFDNSQGLMYQAVEVRRCLQEGKGLLYYPLSLNTPPSVVIKSHLFFSVVSQLVIKTIQ